MSPVVISRSSARGSPRFLESIMNPRVILITGANGGLGLAMARAFLGEAPGNFVWLGVRTNRSRAEALVAEAPGRAACLELDVTQPESWKTAVARVRLFEGSGKFTVNDRAIDDFFTEDRDRALIVAPLETCEMRGKVDVFATVAGGGFTGQAGAICQGVARALKEMFGLSTEAPGADGAESPTNALAKKLRDSGYLTRDGRMKERKKYGRKAARKSFQFSKR